MSRWFVLIEPQIRRETQRAPKFAREVANPWSHPFDQTFISRGKPGELRFRIDRLHFIITFAINTTNDWHQGHLTIAKR
jgi:hypothetical protein